MKQPPRSSAPAWAQAVRYTRDPLGFTVVAQRRYGDVFSVKFPFFGRIFYVASPELAKQVFTGSPASSTPARRTRRCSSRRLDRTRC